MTHDACPAGVALQEPPPHRRGSRRCRNATTFDRPSHVEQRPPAGGMPRPSPAELLCWLDAAALLLVLVPLADTVAMGLSAAAIAILVHASTGLYRARLTLSVLDELPTLLGGAAAGVVIGAAFGTLGTSTSRPWHLLGLIAAATAALVACRLMAHPLERRHRRRAPACPTLIVGTAAVGSELGRTLLADPRYGLLPVGYLDEGSSGRRLPAPLLGGGRDLVRTLEALDVRCVLVAFGPTRPADLVELLRVCDRYRCRIFLVPRFYELHQANRDTDSVGGIPLVRLRPDARHRGTWWLKRAMDVTVAAAGLVMVTPVLALCAIAVRLENGPGVLFRQERIGMDERRFTMLKLRTLRPSSELESMTRWSVADDPRLRPVGRLLRATSLDELPQLVNVLRGEMSLVGPRPERPFFVEDFSRRYPGYSARHRVPVGLTGWAAVNGLRGDTAIDSRASFDNSYVENWSLWLDVKILIRTVGAVLVRSGG